MTGASARGTGPGAITADGCGVDLYAALPEQGEAALVHAAVPPGASVLELGSGAGRVTRALVALGHPVVAVDQSVEMLAHVQGARTVVSGIEELDLGERFDVVLLASHLVNVPDGEVLAALLATCSRHVRPDGCVVIERHPVGWFDRVRESDVERDGVRYLLRDVSRPGPDLLAATVEYHLGGHHWSQSFVTRRLDDVRLRKALRAAGLRLDTVLSDDGSWVRARPSA